MAVLPVYQVATSQISLVQSQSAWDTHQEVVYNVPCKAGDLVIFNEATLHGIPWTADHDGDHF